jgi:hypothetical protein
VHGCLSGRAIDSIFDRIAQRSPIRRLDFCANC